MRSCSYSAIGRAGAILTLSGSLLLACSSPSGKELEVGSQTLGLSDPTARFSAAAAGNFSYGSRSSDDIEYIVVHTMQGYYNGSISWFQNPSSNVSAHYLVRSSDGEVTQMVDVSDVAYHDACFNSRSIGIEHEGFVTEADVWYTDAMYESSARLSAWLAETYGIALDREHILGHGETDDCSDHTDPGPDWDWDRYMTLIREAAEPTLAAELIDFEVPGTALPNSRIEVWFELENQSSDVLDDVRTRLITAEPAERASPLFVQEVWESPSTVLAPTEIVEAGQRMRLTFPVRIPDVADGTLVSEAFQLSHEGKVFGPLLRVELVVQSQALDDGSERPPEAGSAAEDAGAQSATQPEASVSTDGGSSVSSSQACSVGVGARSSGVSFAFLFALGLAWLLGRRRLLILPCLLALLVGCASGAKSSGDATCGDLCDGSADVDPASSADAGKGPSGSVVDAQAADAGGEVPSAQLVEVSHRREMRGVWVASVGNINFPSKQGLSVEEQKRELDRIVEVTAEHGLNAIFFQVRPEADALYVSELEPFSRFLTGTQGKDPGYDPLAHIIEKAHAAGIELHAWLNPYRAASNASATTAASHVSHTLSAYVHKYGSLLWMDPGAKPVQEHTRAVVRDLAERYALDGIHFDDYFYPYPDGSVFPDAASYAAAKALDEDLSLPDFRRASVHALVGGVAEDLRAIKPHLLFGISPFGIYRPGMPAGITGLDQYAEIYSDPMKWIDEGWVDYLAPQLYWPTTQKAQAYEPLLDFWSERAEGHCLMFAGNNLSNLGKTGWDLGEMRTQIELGRDDARVTQGNIFFTLAPVRDNKLGIGALFKQTLYARPALSPVPLRLMDSVRPKPPSLTLTGHTARFSAQGASRGFVLYRELPEGWVVERILPSSEDALLLDVGSWALTSIAQTGMESLGVRFLVEAASSVR